MFDAYVSNVTIDGDNLRPAISSATYESRKRQGDKSADCAIVDESGVGALLSACRRHETRIKAALRHHYFVTVGGGWNKFMAE